MNKKGFMMAELVVVSAIVLVALVAFYASYNKIYSAYKTKLNYYDVTTLYRLGYYRDILAENEVLDDTMNSSVSDVVLVFNSKSNSGNIFLLPVAEYNTDVNDVVYMINNNKGGIDKSKFSGLNTTFYDFIDFFNNSVDYKQFNYVMIMERCPLGDENSCNYAYLEIMMPEETE